MPLETERVCMLNMPIGNARRHWDTRTHEARRDLLEELVRVAQSAHVVCGPNRATDIEQHIHKAFDDLPDMLKCVLAQCADISDINPHVLQYASVRLS